MTNPNQFTNQATKGWTQRLWKGATYTVMSFTAVCGVFVLYGLYNFAANFDEWKADRVKREQLAKEIVSTDEDKDVELERLLGIPPDQTLAARRARREALLLQKQAEEEALLKNESSAAASNENN